MADEPLFDLVAMDPAESAAMQAEINAVLAKYNAEIGVKSEIQAWKRQPKGTVVSPIRADDLKNDGNATT